MDLAEMKDWARRVFVEQRVKRPTNTKMLVQLNQLFAEVERLTAENANLRHGLRQVAMDMYSEASTKKQIALDTLAEAAQPAVKDCGCNFSDSWKCARDQNMRALACSCRCHRAEAVRP